MSGLINVTPNAPSKGGRPSAFRTDIADEICTHIAAGNSLAGWIRDIGQYRTPPVAYSTVMEWLRKDDQFSEDYARARVDSADADADGVADIRERVLRGEIPPDVARVAIDANKWTSGKRNAKKYGEKHLHEISGAIAHVPVTAVDPIEAAREYRRLIEGGS